jgi:hypothetical protein
MNVVKTEVMVVEGGKVKNMISTEAYQRKTTGKRGTHRERSQEKIQCKLCGDLVSRQYLIKHQQTKKCKINCKTYKHVVEEFEEESSDIELDIQEQYLISIQNGWQLNAQSKFVQILLKQQVKWGNILRNRHLEDTIIIEDEGLLPRCTKCGFFQSIVGEKHQKSADCKRFTERSGNMTASGGTDAQDLLLVNIYIEIHMAIGTSQIVKKF